MMRPLFWIALAGTLTLGSGTIPSALATPLLPSAAATTTAGVGEADVTQVRWYRHRHHHWRGRVVYRHHWRHHRYRR